MRIQTVIAFSGALMMLVATAMPTTAGPGAKSKNQEQRRGGYSYQYQDSINTYGDARSNFGGASSLRDPMLDRQSRSGPFDHGFFFDSGIAPRGGDSPYMQ